MSVLGLMLSLMPYNMVAQSYTRSGNNFVAASSSRAKSEPVKTKYTYTKDGKTYPVYVGSTGSCFILKTSSKTGKEYRMYLGEEISRQICKELNIEYKEKKK